MSVLSPWSDPFRDEHAIDRAISIINRQSYFSKSEALITIPVLSLVGGIAGSIGGSIGGSRLAEYVVDITYAGE